MEDTSGADYTHAKRFSKNFEIKALGEYYDLFVRRNRLLLPDEFNFWKMRLEKYGLVPVDFHSTSRLAWKEAWKKTKLRLGPLTKIDMLLMVKRY